jgi:hypothetical protein
MPNLNQVASMDLALTDATGSGADLVPVAIRPLSSAGAIQESGSGQPMPASGPAGLPPNLEIDAMLFRGL